VTRCAAIIPCRYASTRFPGKPLADIDGMPMMWHVYQRVIESRVAHEIYIATDDTRIANTCKSLNLNVLMTGSQHLTGTDRVAEAAKMVDADFIVNVQGDEPLINPSAISAVVETMRSSHDHDVAATNAYAIITDPDEINSNNVVKVVTSATGLAMSYSRLPIPFARGETPTYKRQLGLYCFQKHALQLFTTLEPGPIERAESVEMLRFVEADRKVRMVKVIDESIPVDTPQDLERARHEMAEKLLRKQQL
jgi:3-deoxy-manno-octulosonate cytidylyltransferase (CMP-KDO synthetase)